MNEEYLWNKTGGDAEIEGLENTLKAFSYQRTAPPELPAKVLTLAEKPRRNFFRLGFALAFAAVAVVILSVGWFLIPNRNIAVGSDSVNVIEPQPAIVRQADVPPTSKVELSAQNYTPAIIKARHTVRLAAKQTNMVAIKPKDKDQLVNLTVEEKYAYGQLILALSITESKLKIVRDTIAGNEEMKTNVEKGKNLYQK